MSGSRWVITPSWLSWLWRRLKMKKALNDHFQSVYSEYQEYDFKKVTTLSLLLNPGTPQVQTVLEQSFKVLSAWVLLVGLSLTFLSSWQGNNLASTFSILQLVSDSHVMTRTFVGPSWDSPLDEQWFPTWFSEESFRKLWKILNLEKSYIDTYLVRSGVQYRNLLKHISGLKKRQFQVSVRIVKALVFPVFMYGCESWIINKAEHQRIDTFELWHWRRLLRVPWTARRSNQSILKEISPGCSLEGLMMKLKLQYFGHLMRRANSFEKTLEKHFPTLSHLFPSFLWPVVCRIFALWPRGQITQSKWLTSYY